MNECTESDYSQFHPIDKSSKKKYDAIKNDENHGFFCIDWENEDFDLWGSLSKTYDYNNIDVILAPCQLILPDIGFTTETIREDCIADELS